ncbi:hypothetical protein B9G98_00504 [Wickerhamiella sorbophila]|uniref:Uncharacterized protein n=1 Tax=Wickerhamiella sorbophila TaxID=45607 RepID=A0A2T0FD13_9ASCO|nr:hypothetical protein B9G98_00504 [Wickerhamiella sorbophila]PRT52884.1 hypothetical protein B9G98_00504 [Wickerhamiella sorbophila]
MVFGHNHRKARRLAQQVQTNLPDLDIDLASIEDATAHSTMLSEDEQRERIMQQNDRRERYELACMKLEVAFNNEMGPHTALQNELEEIRRQNTQRSELCRQHREEVFALEKSVVAANAVWNARVVANGQALTSEIDLTKPLGLKRKTFGTRSPLKEASLNGRWRVQEPEGTYK